MKERISPFRHCPACADASDCRSARVFECAKCGFRYFHNVAAAVAAFIVHDGQLLLTRRAHAPAAGSWDLPGGFVDPAESLEQALARELDEELGFTLQPGDGRYLFSLPNIYPYAGVSYATADSFFRIDCATLPRVSARDDVSEAVWIRFGAIELPSIGLESARMAVERFLREGLV
jgi:ADP-ribose pyrophosphatase YjhB (NUDIX family)